MDRLPSLGFCPKCNDSLITEKGIPKCFNCGPGKKDPGLIKPPPAVEIPSDYRFRQPVTGKETVTKLPAPVKMSSTAKDALDIMRNLPMPKDEKEFKKIKKIINLLEKFVGEQ